MSAFGTLPIDDIRAKGRISESDVARFRRVFYEDGLISRQEAECVIDLNDACTDQHPSWAEFFVESVSDFVVYQERPHGYLTAANADWLIEQVSRDGVVHSRTELDLLVNVLEKARWSPITLVTFTMEQVKLAVLTGDGPLRNGVYLKPGQIADVEIELLRRMLYAFGGSGHVSVTRDEADILFDIDEALADADAEVSPAWTDLFVKAIANVVMATSGYRVPSREEALRREASLSNPEQQTSVMAFLLSMVKTNLDGVKDAYQDQTDEERALARLEHQRIEIITNESIDEAEATWLAERLGRDGKLSPSETALVSYFKQESPAIHPALLEAVAKLGSAA